MRTRIWVLFDAGAGHRAAPFEPVLGARLELDRCGDVFNRQIVQPDQLVTQSAVVMCIYELRICVDGARVVGNRVGKAPENP